MHIAFFGSSLVSSYWNGAATYYRGVLRALHALGHRITFLEPDAFGRQQHRDLPDPPWAEVVVWPPTPAGVETAVATARTADVVVKASGVGVFDEWLEAEVLALRGPRTLAVWWDVDAPATLERLAARPDDPLRRLVARGDLVFTYGGGERVVREYEALGAPRCLPIYNAHDPETHGPAEPDPRFAADLALMAHRLPDREGRVEEFFFRAARARPRRRFLLGGNGWEPAALPPNVTWVGHVGTADHNAFNATPLAVLNVSRDSMARYGSSPATRVFEAAAAGACLITDAWDGLDAFLAPGGEWLVAATGDDVVRLLDELTPERARRIGAAARRRVLADHTYGGRASIVDEALQAASRGRDGERPAGPDVDTQKARKMERAIGHVGPSGEAPSGL
jgi:spore maturation protein CgeB